MSPRFSVDNFIDNIRIPDPHFHAYMPSLHSSGVEATHFQDLFFTVTTARQSWVVSENFDGVIDIPSAGNPFQVCYRIIKLIAVFMIGLIFRIRRSADKRFQYQSTEADSFGISVLAQMYILIALRVRNCQDTDLGEVNAAASPALAYFVKTFVSAYRLPNHWVSIPEYA